MYVNLTKSLLLPYGTHMGPIWEPYGTCINWVCWDYSDFTSKFIVAMIDVVSNIYVIVYKKAFVYLNVLRYVIMF